MMNIELPLNFNSPYKARTISDYWDRWHMTLTRFLTKYVYIPLGGSREGGVRTYCNILIVFLLSGFWHGAGWTFVLWGLMHGVFMVITRWKSGFFEKLPSALGWLITFAFANVTWVIFRADTISDAFALLAQLFNFNLTISSDLVDCFNWTIFEHIWKNMPVIDPTQYFTNIFLVGYFLVTFVITLGCSNGYEKTKDITSTSRMAIPTVLWIVWSILSFSGVSVFLYFGF